MIELKYIGCHYKEDTTFLIDRPEGSKDYLLLLFHSDIYVILNDQLEHLSPGSLILYSPNYPQYYYNILLKVQELFPHITEFQLLKHHYFERILL